LRDEVPAEGGERSEKENGIEKALEELHDEAQDTVQLVGFQTKRPSRSM
jgi:hypothetical protein